MRKICIFLIAVCYACGTLPFLMGWFNRPEQIFGVPCFVAGILFLAFLMLGILFVLYRYEMKKGGTSDERGTD